MFARARGRAKSKHMPMLCANPQTALSSYTASLSFRWTASLSSWAFLVSRGTHLESTSRSWRLRARYAKKFAEPFWTHIGLGASSNDLLGPGGLKRRQCADHSHNPRRRTARP